MCDDPNCGCEAEMAASYRTHKACGTEEAPAMAAAMRIYRSRHPYSSVYRALATASEIQGAERDRAGFEAHDRPDRAGQIGVTGPQ